MTSLYIDVSHHDWNRRGGNMDWAAVAAAGVRVVCIRATYGDPDRYAPATLWFHDMAREARAAGLVVGGYHNLIRGDGDSMRRQATWFAEELRLAGARWGMLDVEPYDALKANGLWPRWEDVVAFRVAWQAEPGRPRLSYYVARWVWKDWLGSPDMSTLDGPLVSARYVTGSQRGPLQELYERGGGGEGEGWGSYGGVYPAVWQFTSNAVVPGCTPPTDGDAFKGTGEELIALLTGGSAMRSRNMVVLTDQTRARYPGVVVYGIGDKAHQSSASGHNEDDTPGSKPEDQDADSKPEHRAIDVMIGPAFKPAQAMAYTLALVTVPANRRRLLYVIFDRKIWRAKNGWRQETYTGKDPHTNHVHVSGEADDDENTAPWVLDTQQPKGSDEMVVIWYDGKGYGRGNGVMSTGISTWAEMLDLQAMITAGWVAGSATIRNTTPEKSRAFGPVFEPTVPVDFDALDFDTIEAAVKELSERLAEMDNGLPADAAAIEAAVRAAVEANTQALRADITALAALLADGDNELPADAEEIRAAVFDALRQVRFRAETDPEPVNAQPTG